MRTALAALPTAPHGWAVRSSAVSEDHATTSYAGVYESFLEVPDAEPGPTSEPAGLVVVGTGGGLSAAGGRDGCHASYGRRPATHGPVALRWRGLHG